MSLFVYVDGSRHCDTRSRSGAGLFYPSTMTAQKQCGLYVDNFGRFIRNLCHIGKAPARQMRWLTKLWVAVKQGRLKRDVLRKFWERTDFFAKEHCKLKASVLVSALSLSFGGNQRGKDNF